MLINKLNIELIKSEINKAYDLCDSNSITKELILDVYSDLEKANVDEDKQNFCLALETLYYIVNTLAHETSYIKRQIMQAIFESDKKLFEEKSVLKEKLASKSEYNDIKYKEDSWYVIRRHINSVLNFFRYIKEEDEYED